MLEHDDAAQLPRAAMSRAMRLLARREHSELEIRRRLLEDYPAEMAEGVIARCRELGWLNEARMAGMFIRSRAARGQGPLRITQELRSKGLSQEIIHLALDASECDWFAAAQQLAERRGLVVSPSDRLSFRKALAFMLRRGFTMEQARWACSPSNDAS